MRGAVETVTLWHKSRVEGKDAWARRVLEGVAWEADIIRSVSGGAASLASAFTVLIPAELGAVVFVGDLVAKGAHEVEITGAAPNTEPLVRASLLPEAFTVKAVYDGTAGHKRGRHIEITGV